MSADSADEEPPASDEPAADKATTAEEQTSDEQTWAILAHVSGFVGLVLPFGNIAVPLVIWLIKKDESQFVDDNGRNALNFQITWTIYVVIAAISTVVLIGFALVPLIGLAWVILIVIAAIRTSNGEVYSYPLTFDFVS